MASSLLCGLPQHGPHGRFDVDLRGNVTGGGAEALAVRTRSVGLRGEAAILGDPSRSRIAGKVPCSSSAARSRVTHSMAATKSRRSPPIGGVSLVDQLAPSALRVSADPRRTLKG